MTENETRVVENYTKAMHKCKTKDAVNKLYRQARIWNRFHTHFEFACDVEASREINAKFKEIRIERLHKLGYRTYGEIISSGTIFLDEVTYTSITDMYKKVAELAGYNVTDNTRYNCTKINVARNIQEKLFKYYEEVEHMPKANIGMIWCIYGPKADDSLADDSVMIEEGFFYEENT